MSTESATSTLIRGSELLARRVKSSLEQQGDERRELYVRFNCVTRSPMSAGRTGEATFLLWYTDRVEAERVMASADQLSGETQELGQET